MPVNGTNVRHRWWTVAAVLLLTISTAAATAEPAGPSASREEDNRTERTVETLTAQGTWTGTVRPSAAEKFQSAPARAVATAQPARNKVRMRTRSRTVSRPLNFYDIRRVMFFN